MGCEEKTFLQSWNWGEFQDDQGNKIWRIGIYDEWTISWRIALVIKITARRGTFLLVQHLLKTEKENLKILLEKLKEIGEEEGASFIRIGSNLVKNEENEKIFKDLGFRKSPMHANAYSATWKLDLTPSEEELLMKMRKTTRYLIRQAEKNQDITIEKSEKLSDIEIYQKLNKEVGEKTEICSFFF